MRSTIPEEHLASVRARRWQNRGYRNGDAAAHHQRSAHEGKFDPNCPACIELQKKVAINKDGR